MVGIELQATMMLIRSHPDFAAADNDFWGAKCQTLLVRPALEPIACAYWSRLTAFDLSQAVALVIASTLTGRRLVYRTDAAIGRGRKGDVNFEPAEIASQWLAKIGAAAAEPTLRDALPAYAFAQTLMAHPFSDGNGRFARLMIHAGLGFLGPYRLPGVALAPAFYRHANALGRAFEALSTGRDWAPFNAQFLSILEDAVLITRTLQKFRSGQV